MIHQQWQTYLQRQPAASADGPAVTGIAYLPELAVVRFHGSDARSFLQGYLTCDLDTLSTGALTPTALCNLKGRVVMNGWCTAHGDQDVLLVLHASLVERLQVFLRPYLAFSRTRLENRHPETLVLAGLTLPDEAGGLVLDTRRRLFPVDDLERAREIWAQHPHISDQAWLAALTRDGIPLVTEAVSEAFLPQMLNLDALGAVSFDKGCYLGQEVVARAQHRGQVKRRLAVLTWRGPNAPSPGTDITADDGRAVGVVLQSAVADADTGPLLAVVTADAPEMLRHQDVDLKRID